MPVCTGCVPSWPATGELESKRGCAGGHREHGQTPASKLTCLAHVLCVRAHMCTVAHRPPPAPPPLLRSELLKPAPISQVQGLLGKAELLAPGTAQAMLGEHGKVRGRGGEERKGPRPGGGANPVLSLPFPTPTTATLSSAHLSRPGGPASGFSPAPSGLRTLQCDSDIGGEGSPTTLSHVRQLPCACPCPWAACPPPVEADAAREGEEGL